MFFANLLLFVAYRPQREVLLDTQLYKPMALIWHSAISVCGTELFPFPEKGGRRLVKTTLTILILTQV